MDGCTGGRQVDRWWTGGQVDRWVDGEINTRMGLSGLEMGGWICTWIDG